MSEFKSISTKLPREVDLEFKDFCKRKGVTPSYLIRDLITRELNFPIPQTVAGKNKIEYNKENDTFLWVVELDSGNESEIMKDISPEFLEDLYNGITMALDERFSFIGKEKEDSVPIPSKILRREL